MRSLSARLPQATAHRGSPMNAFRNAALLSLAVSFPPSAMAATFVYVSNADDGDIGVYALQSDGTLKDAGRVPAGKPVMPLATSPDRKLLYARIRSKPFSGHTFAIDPKTGA